jgi:hypothetical protein
MPMSGWAHLIENAACSDAYTYGGRVNSLAPPSPSRPRLRQLLYLALFLGGGAFIVCLADGFPPSWLLLVIVEATLMLVFVLNERREAAWHKHLPDRIRRNDEAAREAAASQGERGDHAP